MRPTPIRILLWIRWIEDLLIAKDFFTRIWEKVLIQAEGLPFSFQESLQKGTIISGAYPTLVDRITAACHKRTGSFYRPF